MSFFKLDAGLEEPICQWRNIFIGGRESGQQYTYGRGHPVLESQLIRSKLSKRRSESFDRMIVRIILFGILLLVARFHDFPPGVNAAEVPSIPFAVEVEVLGRDSVAVSWSPPLSDGGAAVQSYEVEWDTAPGLRTVQSVSLMPR